LSLEITMHNKRFFVYTILVILANGFWLLPQSANARDSKASKVRYVNDNLTITMRTGKSNQHRIIRSLDSGTKVWLLESSDNYSRIKTETGDNGWVLSQYLTQQPIARELLPPLQEKLTKTTAQNKELSQELKDITKERNELKVIAVKYEKLAIDYKKTSEELSKLREASAKTQQLMKQTETRSREKANLQSQLDYIVQEIHELRNGNNKLWFITGAGVIFVGILLGALLTRSRKSKDSSWGSAPKTLMLKQP